jgi:hypothetical protein
LLLLDAARVGDPRQSGNTTQLGSSPGITPSLDL